MITTNGPTLEGKM